MNALIKIYFPLVLLLVIAGCGPSEEEKQAALDSFIEENYVMPDTIIRYTLDSNTLTLEFTNKSQAESWVVQTWLEDKLNSKTWHIGVSDHAVLIDNKLVYTGFGLPAGDVGNYTPRVFAFPSVEGVTVITNPFGNIRIMYTKQDSSENILSPDEYSRTLNYVKFNMHALDSLSPELVEYCALQALEKFNFDPTHSFETKPVDVSSKK